MIWKKCVTTCAIFSAKLRHFHRNAARRSSENILLVCLSNANFNIPRKKTKYRTSCCEEKHVSSLLATFSLYQFNASSLKCSAATARHTAWRTARSNNFTGNMKGYFLSIKVPGCLIKWTSFFTSKVFLRKCANNIEYRQYHFMMHGQIIFPLFLFVVVLMYFCNFGIFMYIFFIFILVSIPQFLLFFIRISIRMTYPDKKLFLKWKLEVRNLCSWMIIIVFAFACVRHNLVYSLQIELVCL